MNSFVSTPARLGHQKIFQELCNNAQSTFGKDLYLRGPKGCGKTTSLRDFASHLRQHSGDYPISVVVEWDLRVDTPTSDSAFRLQMGQKLAEALAHSANQEYRELAEAMGADAEFSSDIQNAFNYLDKPAAFIIDNHDAVLDEGDVSIGMWGQLNELLEARDGHKKLRIFASNRAPLQELARDEEERSSPYFSRLQVEPVEPFDSLDLAACLEPLQDSQIELDESARRELLRWTGGAPALVMHVLEAINAQGARTWNANQIHHLAQSLEEHVENIIGGQWHRTPTEAKNALVELCQNGVKYADLSKPIKKDLKARGWVSAQGEEANVSEFIKGYVETYRGQSNQLRELFGSAGDWEKRFPELLSLRLQSISCPDEYLRSLVAMAIDELSSHPSRALNQMRDIVARALDLVWDAELGECRELPQEWLRRARSNSVPSDSGPQVALLRALLMGFNEDRECLTHCITKPTYELINTLNGAGNYRNHAGSHVASFGFAAVLCLSAIELCAALARDLDS